MNWFSDFFQKSKGASQNQGQMGLTWFPIWEDKTLLEAIRYSIYKTDPKSLKTETRVNLKIVEYSESVEEGMGTKIPLVGVNDLMRKFDASTPTDVLKASIGQEFTPKIVKIQNPIFIVGDTLKDWEVKIQEIEKTDADEASVLRTMLSDLEKTKDVPQVFEPKLKTLHARMYDYIEKRPQLKRDIVFALSKKRDGTKRVFMGTEYCELMSHFGQMQFDEVRGAYGGTLLPVLVPKTAFDSLPPGEIFMGRILGVMYFDAKPSAKNLGQGLVLIAAAISVGTQPVIPN